MLNLVRAWIVVSAALCAAGWILSWFGQLNKFGYCVVMVLLLVAAWIWARRNFQVIPARERWRGIQHKCQGRFRRALPLTFLVLACLIILGGLLHPPVNGDALDYRTPRLLHWLAAEQWHWIHASDRRLNVVSVGFEWLTAPLLVLTRTDRWFFVINALSYLMLPGLVFGVFRQLGVRPRVAWKWMWILPAGWVYAMQAGGVANDHFSTIYGLASVYLALRARQTKQAGDLWLSLLACGLVTGAKQTNVPLALLWFIAVWPSWRILWSRPVTLALVSGWAILASGMPMAYLDLAYTGAWTGWPKGQDYQPASPFWGIVGNGFVFILYNFMPPVFPFAAQWNEARVRFLETSLGAPFTSFEIFACVPRAAAEQTAALGLMVSLLALISFLVAWRIRSRLHLRTRSESFWSVPGLLRLAPWLLLLVFLAKVGSWCAPRYLASYYPFLFPVFLVGAGHDRLARVRWWNQASLSVLLVTIGLIVFSRQRPIWPADLATAHLQEHFPQWGFIRKVRNAYIYKNLREPLKPLLSHLPPDEKTVGYATHTGGAEIQLWWPLGSRQVLRIKAEDSPEQTRQRGIRYVFVDTTGLRVAGCTIDEWARRYHADVLASIRPDFGPELPPVEFHLTRLREP